MDVGPLDRPASVDQRAIDADAALRGSSIDDVAEADDFFASLDDRALAAGTMGF